MIDPRKKKNVSIVLGGTNPHRALIKNLKNRGYYTILVDHLESPPAKEYADYHIQESTLEQDKVLELAKRQKAILVISACVDQAHVTACYVGEKLGLPIPYSYQTALKISDKTTMKESMNEAKIPTSNYVIIKEGEIIDLGNLRFPLVVKPSDSNGSKGVRKAEDKESLDKYLAAALKISRNKKAVVEEFMSGVEIGVDCFIAEGVAHILMLRKRIVPKLADGSVISSIGSITPVDISKEAKRNIQNIANRIAKTFKLNNSALLLQVIVDGDDVKVVEFAPRIGGGLNFATVQQATGFDIIDAAVSSYLGVKVKPVYSNQENYYYAIIHLYTQPGIFGKVNGYKELLNQSIIEGFYQNKVRGTSILPGKASKDRAASFIVKGKTFESIIEHAQTTLNTIMVLDINGHELKHLDIYDKLLFV